MRKVYGIVNWLCTFVCLLGVAYGHEVLVNTDDGETFVLNIDPEEKLCDLQQRLALFSQKKNSTHWNADHPSAIQTRSQGGYLGYPRHYLLEVSAEEKADIRFIITTLANRSLIAIAMAKEELEAAGDRIDHIHPLRFLMTVFADEELKVGIRNIRGKGWVWNHFVGGLKDSLSVESNIGNLKTEFVYHFAQELKIDSNIILPAIIQHKWDDFVDLLITHIPRKGDHDRYDT